MLRALSIEASYKATSQLNSFLPSSKNGSKTSLFGKSHDTATPEGESK